MNDLLGYVLESFFDSRQEKLNMLSKPEILKSKDVVEYIRSNMKGSKTKPGAFLREGALYFLNSMVKEGGALDRGKPGTFAPGYAFVGGKREYGRVSGDAPLRKVQRPLIVPDVDYPGVSKEKIVDVVVQEGLAMFRRWSNRNKPRFFAYTPSKPLTKTVTEDNTTELVELYESHTKRFRRLHDLVLEHNNATPINFSTEKGKLPIGTDGLRTGITINRAPQARWLCLKLRIKEGATWTMYSSSVGKLGVMLSRAGLQPMVSTYGRLWDIWVVLPDELPMPDAYDLIGNMDGIERIGRASKGVAFRPFLMDSVIISDKTFADDTCIFPLSLHIHHGKEKVATNQKGMGNQDFRIDTGLSMIPSAGMLTLFDQGIENHPLQAMFNAPELLARVYRFARSAEIIPQLKFGSPLLEIDSSLSNMGREAWVRMKEHKDDSFMGELRVAPKGRDVTLVYDGKNAYLAGLPDDRILSKIPHTEEFAQLCTSPTVVYGKLQGENGDALMAMLAMMDVNDYDEKKIYQAFSGRTILVWSSEHFVDLHLNTVSGQHIRSVKRAAPDDLNEMMNVSPHGLIVRNPYGMDEDGMDELIPANQNTPVVVLGFEKDSVQNNEARVIIVGKVVSASVDVLGQGKNKPLVKQGKQVRDEYQEVARVGTFSGFNYEDRKDLYQYMSNLDYQREHEGDILIDPVEAGIILEMEYRGLLKDKPMWRYNRKGTHRDWEEKQKLPGMGERDVVGVKSTYSIEPLNKEPMPQYSNPKIVGYRVEMGREEQRIAPFLIPSSDVSYGVGIKENPPLEMSKYTNYVEKEDSPFLSVLGFTSENAAKEDLKEFSNTMSYRFGSEIRIVHNRRTLTALKKGTKIGEVCENCGGPKAFSPPGFTKQERAADEGPSVYFSCSICGRETRQRDRRNPPQFGWNTIMDWTNDGTWTDEFLQIKSATKQMMEWFPDNNFSIRAKNERINYEGDINDNRAKFHEAFRDAVWNADFPQPSNVLVITDKKYKGNYFGYTSGYWDGEVRSQLKNDNPWHMVLFSLPHLRNYDEETNFMTICHEWGHHMIRKGIESEGRGRLDDSYHCKDKSCVMSLESYKMAHFKNKLKAEGRFNKSMFCDLCEAEIGLKASPFLKENPLVSVEAQKDNGDLKIAQKIIGYDKANELSEEAEPYLHTAWPEWFRRDQRDLLVRGLEHLDYEGVIKGISNKTGSPYYKSLLGIAKRNSGKGLIKNRKQHQELAMLYTLCHNDVDFILTWPNATSSDMLDKFESELESSSTIIYQKEISLTKKAAAMLCMQMYAGEDFVSKKQCVRKTLASGWLKEDDDDEERKIRIYLIHSGSEKTLRGQAAPRKEELRSIFKTSKDDKKSYIHTADNPVQVTEYAQVLLNENSLILLQHNNIDLILPRYPNREWLMINSVKKYMQQEFGSLFFLCSSLKSGVGAYLHGIRKTNDVDMMIDDRRLGPDATEKIERMKTLFPFFDPKLAYSERNSNSFWDYETFVPGKTFYDKRNEMTHNPKYHAYFLGLKVETPEGFLYQRMARVSNDSRPRATSDLLMLLILIDEGRFRFLDKKIQVPWKRSMVESYDDLSRWMQTAKFWIKTRYSRDMPKKDIWGLLKVAIKHNQPRKNRDLDATEEHLLSSIDGRYNDFSETRNNPSKHRIILTVPHALHAGDDYEDHWCDWSAAPAARQLFSIIKNKHDTHIQMADKKRTEIDYNRAISADTRWQLELDGLLEKADLLVDIHSFPEDDPMWAGYDFVLFSSDKWPMKAQHEQAQLMALLRDCGYKVMMDIADHRNYIQEKGVKLGIPSFLVEFGEHLKLKKPCEDLAKCLDTFFVKSNPPVAPGYYHVTQFASKIKSEGFKSKFHPMSPLSTADGVHAWTDYNLALAKAKRDAGKTLRKADGTIRQKDVGIVVIPYEVASKYVVHKSPQYDAAVIIEIPEGEKLSPEKLQFVSMDRINPPNTHVVISRSDKADKKLKAVFHKPNGRTKTTHFGGKHYSDYTIHNDRKRMERYNNRHRKNENWNDYMSAGALSKWILWNKPSLKGSFDDYLDMFGITGELKVKTSQAGEIKHGKKNPPVGFVGPKGRDWFVGDDGFEPGGLVREKGGIARKGTRFTNTLVGEKSTLIPYCEYAGNVNLMKIKEDVDEICKKMVEFGRKNYDLPNLDFIDEKGVKEDIISMYSIVIAQHEAMHVETVDEIPPPSASSSVFAPKKRLLKKYQDEQSRIQDSKERIADLASIETMESLGSLTIFYTDGIVSEFKVIPGDMPGFSSWINEFSVLKENPIGLGLPFLIGKIVTGMSRANEQLEMDHFDALPNPTPHFFPGEAVKKFPWLKHSDLIKTNPPVFPRPERVSGKKGGKYLTDSGKDVTGLHFKKAEILGSDKSINVEWKNQVKKPEPKPAPKSGMRRVRFNMLRPSKFDGYDDSWIVASETSKGHIYSLRVKVHGVLTLKTFPKKKSEPRLRPETYGSLVAFNQIGEITIKSSGKKHPLYDAIFVMDSSENKKFPKKMQKDLVRRNKGGGGFERLYNIVVPFVKTLHPQLDVFDSGSLVERLKNAGKGRFAESRQLGRTVLPRMLERGLVRKVSKGTYANTERRYNEHLAEQEEARDNPPRKITPSYVRSNLNTLFVFGDNDQRRGKGGQAVIRDEPNAIGLRTKKAPRTSASAYYVDSEYDENISKMREDFKEISRRSAEYEKVYYIPGIGEGLAKLKEKAPKTYAWMKKKMVKQNPRTPEGRKVPKRYLKGLNKTEKAIAKYEVDRGYKYDIDDPEAYEDWKSDIMAKARGMETAPSRFKLKFIKKYGPLPKGKDLVSRLAKATGVKKQYIQKAYDKGLAAWRGGHRPGTVQHQWASGRAYALVMGAPTSTGKGKPDFQLAVKAGVRDKNGKLLI